MIAVERQLDPSRTMFRVRGNPMAKPRQTRRDVWDPWEPVSDAVQRYRFWADIIRIGWLSCSTEKPWKGAIAFGGIFMFPIPENWSKNRRAQAMADQVPHTVKPDLDNLIKGALDALNGSAYIDDAQVSQYIEPLGKIWVPPDDAGAWIILDRL